MRRPVLLFGLVGGLLVAALRLIEYRWLLVEHSVEIYGALIAAIFAGAGIWIGSRVTRRPPVVVATSASTTVASTTDFVRDDERVRSLGITPRELEILEWIAEGLSNKEIAARAFVSENTVKTHSSRLLAKLGAARRTQAVSLAKSLQLIP